MKQLLMNGDLTVKVTAASKGQHSEKEETIAINEMATVNLWVTVT
jgi:hypothetical protein